MTDNSGRNWSRRQVGKLFGGGLGAILGSGLARNAQAADYPNKLIKLVTGYPAGGGITDTSVRLVANHLSGSFSRVIVENKPGASGSVGLRLVAQADPDGYTLFYGTNAEISIYQYLTDDKDFHPDTDLIPIVPVYFSAHMVVVSANSPYQTLSELLDAARARPGTIRIGSPGAATPAHIAGIALATRGGVKMVHVPYTGGSKALTDVMGGQIESCVPVPTTVKGFIESGTIRALAVTSQDRIEEFPDVPTVREVLGVEKFDFPLFSGIFAPTGTAPDIVATIHQEVSDALKDPGLNAEFNKQSIITREMSTDDFKGYIREQNKTVKGLLDELGLTKSK